MHAVRATESEKLLAFKDRLFILDLILAISPFVFLFALWIGEPTLRFDRAVKVGMSKEEVFEAVNAINGYLEFRETNEQFESDTQAGPTETWICHLAPGSWEWKLTFRDKRLVEIELIGS